MLGWGEQSARASSSPGRPALPSGCTCMAQVYERPNAAAMIGCDGILKLLCLLML